MQEILKNDICGWSEYGKFCPHIDFVLNLLEHVNHYPLNFFGRLTKKSMTDHDKVEMTSDLYT